MKMDFYLVYTNTSTYNGEAANTSLEFKYTM